MTVDADLVGAWTRWRLTVDGVRCRDPGRVLWLQTGDWYADIRLPRPAGATAVGPEATFARPWAFAGTAAWNPPVMTWHHHFDSMLQPNIDSNPLEREGDVLVESGDLKWAGLWVPFRQEWRRLSPREVPVDVKVSAGRMHLTIGVWRIVIDDDRPSGPFRASREEFDGGAWRVTGTIVEPACPLRALARTPSRSSQLAGLRPG
jgi:hypothetical protein